MGLWDVICRDIQKSGIDYDASCETDLHGRLMVGRVTLTDEMQVRYLPVHPIHRIFAE